MKNEFSIQKENANGIWKRRRRRTVEQSVVKIGLWFTEKKGGSNRFALSVLKEENRNLCRDFMIFIAMCVAHNGNEDIRDTGVHFFMRKRRETEDIWLFLKRKTERRFLFIHDFDKFV